MIFNKATIDGVFLIELEKQTDERGLFARTWDKEEFGKRGLFTDIVQCSTSYNNKKGTLRGMHYQEAPHAEAKLVRCTRGALYDVVLDTRSDSPTFKKWFATELSVENGLTLYIPEGCAHGFQTLVDDTDVFYQMSVPYAREFARGIRFDDPAFGITWPETKERIISEKDRSYPDWKP